MKKKAFTLIELIAVLVILAILALIVTPLVMNIIRKAKTAADKRSIDAYGRSIELAIAGYLLDTGKFPTSIGELTVEYKGDEVACSTTQIKSDSLVYLAGCTVGGREVKDYTYGKYEAPTYTAYQVGDEVTYNNVDYYVIKDSDSKESTVTLLKAEPLTVEEVNTYGINHVNKYPSSSKDTAYNVNEYGGVAYYSSDKCGWVSGTQKSSECTTDYQLSEVKYIVDAWAISEIPMGLQEARLITFDDLVNNLGYDGESEISLVSTDSVPDWIYNSNYWYWTSISYNMSDSEILYISSVGSLFHTKVYNDVSHCVVRPVIVLDKSVLPNE